MKLQQKGGDGEADQFCCNVASLFGTISSVYSTLNKLLSFKVNELELQGKIDNFLHHLSP